MDISYYHQLYDTLQSDACKYIPQTPEQQSLSIIYYTIGLVAFIAFLVWIR